MRLEVCLQTTDVCVLLLMQLSQTGVRHGEDTATTDGLLFHGHSFYTIAYCKILCYKEYATFCGPSSVVTWYRFGTTPHTMPRFAAFTVVLDEPSKNYACIFTLPELTNRRSFKAATYW